MENPLRVLIVEDSEDDALLLSRELRRGGYQVEAHRVDTAEAFDRALAANTWDVIIADYNMPQFDGLAALRVLQEQAKDIPFLVVSGFIDENVAVAAMKSGAHDYLMKDNLKRLVPAVTREIREVKMRRERRQATEALRTSEARLRQANDALLYLARSQSVQEGDLPHAFAEITQTMALSLGISRAGIWIFNPERTILHCEDLFEMEKNQHSRGLALQRDRYPRYFAALQEHRFISATDSMLDPRTKEFADDYFRPHEIVSSLEAGIRLHGEVVGVFSLEHCRQLRQWMPEEEVFAGSVADLISLALGASERRKSEEALRASEQRYRDLFENANDMIYTMNLDGVLTSINKRGEELTGYSRDELLGVALGPRLLPPEHEEVTLLALQRKLDGELDQTVYEVEIVRKDGQRVAIEINSRLIYENEQPAGLQGIARDISERKRLEDELRHSQKMEAIGRLAGAIAHDFNNLLTAILGYSQLLLARLDANSPWRREIAEIEKAGRSAATLTGQLLAFSRKQAFQPQTLNVNQVVTNIERMLRRLIGEDVELVTQLDATLGNIHADPGRVEQVIMNLVVNSRDAMPRGGRLVIETSNAYLDPAYASRHPDARPGSYVMLSVADTGVGMSHNVLSRIFEPFFTTKDAGKGTGLGLSTVYGIVKQSDGHIVVESAPGAGAIFRVFFPRIDDTVMMTESPTPYIAQGGHETVLLVEDDDAVRELTRQILEMNGYKVLEAYSANEALTICRTYAGVIACVLADVVMPQISGPDMVRQLVDIRPSLKAVYMSGYNDHQLLPQTAHTEQPVLLNKPFTPEMLAKTVRSVLDGSAGSQ